MFQGGRLCCTARCAGRSTHSRPQVTSAGAETNHGFFACQQPRRKFFRGGRAPAGRGGGGATVGTAARSNVEAERCAAATNRTPCGNTLFYAFHFARRRIGRQARAARARSARRCARTRRDTPGGGRRHVRAVAPDGASQQPDCADLRKKRNRPKRPVPVEPTHGRLPNSSGARLRSTVSDRLPRAARRTRRGRASR